MPEKNTATPEEKKLFTVNDITIGTFLSGPFTGILCMEHNYKALGSINMAKKVRFWGVSIITAIFALVIFLPEAITSKIPNMLFILLFTGGTWLYFKKCQLPKILTQFPEKNFSKKSVWKTILKMLIGLLITIGVFFLLGFIQGFFSSFILGMQGA